VAREDRAKLVATLPVEEEAASVSAIPSDMIDCVVGTR